jgi:hypothetical protein
MKTYWVCVAHRWAIPAVECGARGEGDSSADRHVKATGHSVPDWFAAKHQPTCVNPAHLEAVTQAENNRRAVAVRMGVAS